MDKKRGVGVVTAFEGDEVVEKPVVGLVGGQKLVEEVGRLRNAEKVPEWPHKTLAAKKLVSVPVVFEGELRELEGVLEDFAEVGRVRVSNSLLGVGGRGTDGAKIDDEGVTGKSVPLVGEVGPLVIIASQVARSEDDGVRVNMPFMGTFAALDLDGGDAARDAGQCGNGPALEGVAAPFKKPLPVVPLVIAPLEQVGAVLRRDREHVGPEGGRLFDH